VARCGCRRQACTNALTLRTQWLQVARICAPLSAIVKLERQANFVSTVQTVVDLLEGDPNIELMGDHSPTTALTRTVRRGSCDPTQKTSSVTRSANDEPLRPKLHPDHAGDVHPDEMLTGGRTLIGRLTGSCCRWDACAGRDATGPGHEIGFSVDDLVSSVARPNDDEKRFPTMIFCGGEGPHDRFSARPVGPIIQTPSPGRSIPRRSVPLGL
jgi:hypothetical protein